LHTSRKSKDQAWRVPGGSDSQIPRQSAHEGGKVVSPTHRPPPPRNTPCTHFCYRLKRPQGHSAAGMMSIKKFQWHHQESNPRHCSALPRSNTPPRGPWSLFSVFT
jgi:hypothetical protein